MEKIDRELLIKEISSRLPYGVKAQVCGWDEEKGEVEVPLKVYSINTEGYLSFEYNHYSVETVYVEDCRLYLRPMSSMTEKEFESLKEYSGLKYDQLDLASYQNGTYKCLDFYLSEVPSYVVILVFDWLNKKGFDYRGLIKLGLALEAPEGMYNLKVK